MCPKDLFGGPFLMLIRKWRVLIVCGVKRFWLLPWQEQLIRDIFGIVKPDGYRIF